MEGYVDLGLPEEAIEVMHKLTSELSLTDAEGEQFMNVLMKTNLPALPAMDETKRATASLSTEGVWNDGASTLLRSRFSIAFQKGWTPQPCLR